MANSGLKNKPFSTKPFWIKKESKLNYFLDTPEIKESFAEFPKFFTLC